MSALIEAHCDGLRYSDQLPTFDPPKHTRHRGLLLRLLTPRRLQDNEASMWRLADAVMDEFTGEGRCEFVADFAGPFAMLVIADLLGVPEEDHDLFRRGTGQVKGGFGSTNGEQLAHMPLEFLCQAFTAYIEDRHRSLRGDVLSRLAAATYKDGSTLAVIDVARLAANLFVALTTSTGSGRSRTPTTGPPTSPFSPPGHRRATGSARSGESPRWQPRLPRARRAHGSRRLGQRRELGVGLRVRRHRQHPPPRRPPRRDRPGRSSIQRSP